MSAHPTESRHILVGQSPRTRQVIRLIEKLGKCRWPALLLGETGTGKEVVARSVHNVKASGPFVTVDCSSMVGPLMESELFGHVKGAFTGAANNKFGLLEAANGGTAFFDEIGDLPLELQVKLLRVLQEHEYRPLGSLVRQKVDMRVISATHRDLPGEVERGNFRQDLYYRLNVITVRIPALRERKDDIALLANHFLRKYEKPLGRSAMRFSKGAMRVLIGYGWPGNVRELENAVERAAILAETDVIHAHDLPEKLHSTAIVSAAAETTGMTLEELEREHMRRVLNEVSGDKVKAAQVLGIHLSTLYRKVQRYRLENEGTGQPAASKPALQHA